MFPIIFLGMIPITFILAHLLKRWMYNIDGGYDPTNKEEFHFNLFANLIIIPVGSLIWPCGLLFMAIIFGVIVKEENVLYNWNMKRLEKKEEV